MHYIVNSSFHVFNYIYLFVQHTDMPVPYFKDNKINYEII